MAIDDAARLHLYEQARSTWGAEAANTLISTMPTNIDLLATKDDLENLDLRLRGEIKQSAADTIRTLMFGMIATNATLVGLVLAAVRLG